jgi:SAM-dependent methyltransferase
MRVLQQVKEQLPLWRGGRENGQPRIELRDAAAADNKTKHVHRWAPWIAGFSATFVEDVIESYLPEFGRAEHLVLDPFAGVATTLVEGLKAGCNVAGFEINGFAAMAARAKIACIDVEIDKLGREIEGFRVLMSSDEAEIDRLFAEGDTEGLAGQLNARRAVAPNNFKSRIPFYSPPVEAKFLHGLAYARALPEPDRSLFLTALGATMVSFSNYTYEPSLGSRPGAGKPLIDNASVRDSVSRKLSEILEDIRWVQQTYSAQWRPRSRTVQHASYLQSELPERSVSLVVTSPPYMNNYHYVRNTRPQLHWLGLLSSAAELKDLERRSFGKFWQVVRQGPRVDLSFEFLELERALDELRGLHPEKGHYGGAGWANYVATYFNDSHLFLQRLHRQLRPGGHAVIVVGNSIIQGIEFRVDHLLAEMAEQLSINVEDVRVVRTKRVGNSIIDSTVRNGTANGHGRQIQLYDAAVILRG